jgi:nucleotide-binding universal stress UspA family protein
MRIERIVVGIDGSSNSDRAASVAADLAELAGAEVIAVHAMGLLEDLPDPGETLVDHRAHLRQTFETTWTALIHRTGIRLRCELRDGDPVDAILAVAEECDADVIVMGTSGHGALPEQSLGSTSAQVAATTRRPMLLVPDTPESD